MNPIELPAATDKHRVTKALAIAVAYGRTDVAHHKDWVIDQMVRALTGCPVRLDVEVLAGGKEFILCEQLESEAYKELVAQACAGEDGSQTYGWSTGIAP